MNLSLRAKLRLAEGCSEQELQDACNRYYAIYKGVMDSAASEAVKAVAGSKLADLVEHARREGVTLQEMEGISFVTQSANINATVEQELSSCKGTLSPEKAAWLEKKIDALPQSAKRYYLSALVVLGKNEGTIDSFREAVTKLKSAASQDPQNIVYDAMLITLDKEIRDYNTKLTDWQEKEIERIKSAQRVATFKKVMSAIGSVLLWLGGAALTVAGVLFSCMCSMCDGC